MSDALTEKFNILPYAGHTGTLLIDDVGHMAELAIIYDITIIINYDKFHLCGHIIGTNIKHKVLYKEHNSKEEAWCWAIGLTLLEI